MKYQSQFVPTNFSGIGNVLGMYRQDLQQRDKDFDEGVMFQNEALAQLGSLQSEDLEGKQQRINAITTAMDEVAKKHGGDYAKASKDLYRLVAQEKANPWYQMNNKLNEAVKMRRQLASDADNIVIGGDIRTVADAQKAVSEGRDPFNVSAIKKSNVYDTASKIFTNFADQLTSNPQWKSTLGGQYFERMQKFGQRPEDIEGFLSTGEGKAVMDSIISEYPQLAQASDKQLRNVIKQAAYSAVGKDVVDTQTDRGYDYRMREALKARAKKDEEQALYPLQKTGTALVPTSVNDMGVRMYKRMGDTLAQKEAKSLGIEGVNTLEDLKKMTSGGSEAFTDMGVYPGEIEQLAGTWKVGAEKRNLARKAIENINTKLKNKEPGIGLSTYNINTIISRDPKRINELKTVRDELNYNLNDDIDTKFSPMTSKDERELKKIVKNRRIIDVATDFNKDETGLIFFVQGEDKDGKPVNSTVMLDPKQKEIEIKYSGLLRQLNPIIGIEKDYSEMGEEYLDYLEKEVFPNVQSQSGKEAMAEFINLKRQSNAQQ